jgi:hypothetical protein
MKEILLMLALLLGLATANADGAPSADDVLGEANRLFGTLGLFLEADTAAVQAQPAAGPAAAAPLPPAPVPTLEPPTSDSSGSATNSGSAAATGDAPDAAALPAVPSTPAAAPEAIQGPFAGTWVGPVYGDHGSSALLRLDLTHEGDVIAGTASVGEGLQVAAGGFCGTIAVPAATLQARETVASTGNHLETVSTISVSGFNVDVGLNADLAADGNSLAAQATLFTPSLCATNPVLTGTLTRIN